MNTIIPPKSMTDTTTMQNPQYHTINTGIPPSYHSSDIITDDPYYLMEPLTLHDVHHWDPFASNEWAMLDNQAQTSIQGDTPTIMQTSIQGVLPTNMQPLPLGPPSRQTKPRKTRSDKGKPRAKKGTTNRISPESNISSGSDPSTAITQYTPSPPQEPPAKEPSVKEPPVMEPPAKKQRKTRCDSKLVPKSSDESLGSGFFMSEPVTKDNYKKGEAKGKKRPSIAQLSY